MHISKYYKQVGAVVYRMRTLATGLGESLGLGDAAGLGESLGAILGDPVGLGACGTKKLMISKSARGVGIITFSGSYYV